MEAKYTGEQKTAGAREGGRAVVGSQLGATSGKALNISQGGCVLHVDSGAH